MLTPAPLRRRLEADEHKAAVGATATWAAGLFGKFTLINQKWVIYGNGHSKSPVRSPKEVTLMSVSIQLLETRRLLAASLSTTGLLDADTNLLAHFPCSIARRGSTRHRPRSGSRHAGCILARFCGAGSGGGSLRSSSGPRGW